MTTRWTRRERFRSGAVVPCAVRGRVTRVGLSAGRSLWNAVSAPSTLSSCSAPPAPPSSYGDLVTCAERGRVTLVGVAAGRDLVPNKENSGVQFRSEALPDGEMKGPQADVGLGWWGKLSEESDRGILSDNKFGEQVVKVDDWNEYVIVAEGSRVKTWINGQLCVDLDDPKLSRRGIFAFQIHFGGAMAVRFKDLKLEVLPPREP